MSLLVPDPEEAEQHGVQLPVHAHAALPQPREGLLRHVAAVRHVQLRQGPAVLAHRAHTCTTPSMRIKFCPTVIPNCDPSINSLHST